MSSMGRPPLTYGCIQKLLVITPTKRLTVGAVLAHSYFDVLRQTRDGSTNLCNDAKLTNMVIMTRLRASFKRQYRNLGRARWRREKQAKKLAKNRRLLLSWLIDLAEELAYCFMSRTSIILREAVVSN